MDTAARAQESPTGNGTRAIGSSDDHRPLGAYALLAGAFNAAFATALVTAHRSGRLGDLRGGDVVLAAVATQKLSRLLAKAKVTSFLRAPFTRHQGESGPAEVSETPRGTGMQKVAGELVSCPYCLAQWLAAGFTLGLMAAPRPTRAIAGTYAVLGLADFLQVGYAIAEEKL